MSNNLENNTTSLNFDDYMSVKYYSLSSTQFKTLTASDHGGTP